MCISYEHGVNNIVYLLKNNEVFIGFHGKSSKLHQLIFIKLVQQNTHMGSYRIKRSVLLNVWLCYFDQVLKHSKLKKLSQKR